MGDPDRPCLDTPSGRSWWDPGCTARRGGAARQRLSPDQSHGFPDGRRKVTVVDHGGHGTASDLYRRGNDAAAFGVDADAGPLWQDDDPRDRLRVSKRPPARSLARLRAVVI